jgi:hypothetical protein
MKTINLSFALVTIIAVSCLVLGMVSVGHVAAQTASSTEEAATSTPETPPASSGEVAGEATTIIEEVAAPEPVQEAEPAPAPPQEAISAAAAAVGEIGTLQQQHMAKYGRYGPEAADRTFAVEFPKPAASATSTPEVQ